MQDKTTYQRFGRRCAVAMKKSYPYRRVIMQQNERRSMFLKGEF